MRGAHLRKRRDDDAGWERGDTRWWSRSLHADTDPDRFGVTQKPGGSEGSSSFRRSTAVRVRLIRGWRKVEFGW